MLLKKLIAFSCILGSMQCTASAATTTFEEQSTVGHELKIPVHRWYSAGQTPKAIIVAVQGLVFDGKAYDALAKHLNNKGYVVYAADMRGFGGWTQNKGEFDGDSAIHFTKSKDDLTNVLKALRKQFPDTPIICMGESLGANYAVWEASTVPDLLDGAIACSISYKINVHPRTRWALTFVQGLSHPKTPLNIEPYLSPTLTHNKELTERILKSPQTVTKMSVTDLIKAALTNKYAVQDIDKIPESMPILIMAGKEDQIQKTSTIPEMVSKMGSKQTSLVVFKDKGHLLLEDQSVDAEVAETIDNWLDDHAKRRTMGLGKAISSAKSTTQAENLSSAARTNAASSP